MRIVKIVALVAVAVTALPGAAGEGTHETERETATPRIEAVFVLDTTGSMSGLIAAAKEKIWSIANTLATTEPAPEIKMGLVGFRDRGDRYVTKRLELTEDIDAVYAFLMQFRANGGGDAPESVNQALHEAVVEMGWSVGEQVYRVVFLVGDSPPHMDYTDDIKFPESCKLAAERGIIINTIQCGNQSVTTPIWGEIAKRAEGEFFRVEQSGSAIVASTPFDSQLGILSRELDGTRIYYGSAQERASQAERDKTGAALYERGSSRALAARATFNASKAGKWNFSGGKELIDDILAGRVSVADVPTDEFSEELKKMSQAERGEHVRKTAERRAQLQTQIAELSAKRQAYIQEQIEKAGPSVRDSLDVQLYECIRTQAETKNIVYAEGPLY
jgi:Mg-chelatase subunit ChlD